MRVSQTEMFLALCSQFIYFVHTIVKIKVSVLESEKRRNKKLMYLPISEAKRVLTAVRVER